MRIISYNFASLSHEVLKYSIYEPGKNPYHFKKGEEQKVLKKFGASIDIDLDDNAADANDNEDEEPILGRNPLEDFFDLCKADANAREYTFLEINKSYVYERSNKKGKWIWRERKNQRHWQIARIYPVSPRQAEKFALRLLAISVKGPTSYDDLKTVPGKNKPCDTFSEAARLLNILDDQDIWERTLEEATSFLLPRQMRDLLIQIIVFGHPQDAMRLWMTFKDYFYDTRNILNVHDQEVRINQALYLINEQLESFGLSNESAGIPMPDSTLTDDVQDKAIEDFFFPAHFGDDPKDQTTGKAKDDCYHKMNIQQKNVVDIVEEAMNNPDKKRLFFLHGSGGTGKTFIYNTLIDRCRQKRRYSLPMASTGIAATLIFNGATIHSTFCIPADRQIDANFFPHIGPLSLKYAKLKMTELIVIDEVTMVHKNILSALDNVLRIVTKINKPFGNKVLLLGGDWKQLLVVVKGAFDNIVNAQISACIQSHELYDQFEHLHLTQNMRSLADPIYATFLERVINNYYYLSFLLF
jgi:hypothetical protein